jgi:hypothetical protein
VLRNSYRVPERYLTQERVEKSQILSVIVSSADHDRS